MTTESDYQSALSDLPCWRGRVSSSRLYGGFSTITFKVIDETGAYVARCGSDVPVHEVSRAREGQVSLAAASIGISPRVLYTGCEVLVLDFIEGDTFSKENVGMSAARLGSLLSKIHTEMPAIVGKTHPRFDVFDTNRRYFATLEGIGHPSIPSLKPYMELLGSIQDAQVDLPQVFGHHDLLPSNLLDDSGRIWVIDWEYAGYGSPLFDLANLSSNSDLSVEQDVTLLDAYFKGQPSEPMLRSFCAMKVASLLREGLWGLVSRVFVRNSDVDYDAHCGDYERRLKCAVEHLRVRYQVGR